MWLEGTGYTPVECKVSGAGILSDSSRGRVQASGSYDVLMQSGISVIPAFIPNNSTIDTVIKDAMLSFGDGTATKEETFNAIKDGCAKALEDYYRANLLSKGNE